MKLRTMFEDAISDAIAEVNRCRKDRFISSHKSIGEIITMVAQNFKIDRSKLASALSSRRQKKVEPVLTPETKPATQPTLFDISKTKPPMYNH